MPRRAIIDADYVVYEVGHSVVRSVDIDGDIATFANVDEAKSKADAALRAILAKVRAGDERPLVALSDQNANWRTGVYPDYKGNRKATGRPGCYGALRAHLQSAWGAVIRPRLEADDVCGIAMTAPADGDQRVLVSIDKDLLTIPGEHYDPWKDRRFAVSTVEAVRAFFTQALVGDRVDNYPGCPGVGPVKAAKILAAASIDADEVSAPALWRAVVEAYKKAGQPESVALTQARIARILHHGDYDPQTKEVRLWQPPKQ